MLKINTKVSGYQDVDKSNALELISNMYSLARNRKLERRLASIVTDVCDECLGTGSLQFCGGETCPSCNGTGEPPKEVKVYKCINCGTESLDCDSTNFTICSPLSNSKHEFILNTVYTKETK